MRGYPVHSGYMGYVPGGGYRLFETEGAYYEWYQETYKEATA